MLGNIWSSGTMSYHVAHIIPYSFLCADPGYWPFNFAHPFHESHLVDNRDQSCLPSASSPPRPLPPGENGSSPSSPSLGVSHSSFEYPASSSSMGTAISGPGALSDPSTRYTPAYETCVTRSRGSPDHVSQLVIRILLALPSSRAKISSELSKAREQIRSKLITAHPDGVRLTAVRSLPEKGRDRAWLEEEWRNLKLLERGDVGEGRVSGTVYHVGDFSLMRFTT